MRAVTILAALLVAASAPSAAVSSGDKIFDLTRVHRIRLSIPAAEWAVLQTSGGRSTAATGGSDYTLADGRPVHLSSGFANYLPWAHADMRIEKSGDGASVNVGAGQEFKNIGIRYKGNSSFSRSTAAAPLLANFKLKIDQYGTNGTWDGEKTFNLQSGVVDTSRMRDSVAYWLFRTAGVPAPRTTYAEIIFNVPGVYQDMSAGMFTIIEDVNKKFLERVLPQGTGLLMKPESLGGGIHSLGETWAPYAAKLRPDRDATPHEQQRVMEFSALVSQSDVALFRAKIGAYLDVDEFLRFVAVNAFSSNWDSYLNGSHNFYLYLDPKDDKFRFIPWDEDLSLQMRGGGGTFRIIVRPDGTAVNSTTVVNGVTFTNGTATDAAIPGADIMSPVNANQPLIYWLLDDPAVATQYRAIIRELASTAFSPAELTKLMDALEHVGLGAAAGGSPREFVLSRASMVQQLVAGWAK